MRTCSSRSTVGVGAAISPRPRRRGDQRSTSSRGSRLSNNSFPNRVHRRPDEVAAADVANARGCCGGRRISIGADYRCGFDAWQTPTRRMGQFPCSRQLSRVQGTWSNGLKCAGRIVARDRPFLDCLAELEPPTARLTSRAARAIVVAGLSQGGLAALVFGARRLGLAGVIALAPNGAPERLPRSQRAWLAPARWSPKTAAMNLSALPRGTSAGYSPSRQRRRFI